ncbi:hypothetical protein BVC80_8895g7 [Macleaya cordata]|uniref:Transmembrane protein n=1 Tax=Macleaya cordata TaxID=56857 RepID=A0A200Q3V4_MACCD|nr:hypothetical protein BVC80_8895g7 [Macleaya cordata]
MTQQPCIIDMSSDHVTPHAEDASRPVPVIGLCTALVTMVCFFSMLYDTLVGFRFRKPWLPCQYFALNSFTLSLLSIATKLPVDLTTSMPSAQDQLSKLSSTSLICICLGFFMPSLGIKQELECFSNMAALTVLVVTVVVDVCVQMVTGVIFVFKVEHVIILVCMLVLLAVLWISHCATTGMVCTVCLVVLVEAVLRTLAHKESKSSIIGKGGVVSDYEWSVWIVVVTQLLTFLLGSLVVGLRWFTLVAHMNLVGLGTGMKC